MEYFFLIVTILLAATLSAFKIFYLPFFQEILFALAIFLVLLIFWIVVKFVQLRKVLDYIYKIEKSPLKEYVYGEIKSLYKSIIEKITADGVEMTQENVNMLTKALFKSGEGTYIGVESNLPSEYFKKYPKYLDYHANYIEERRRKGIRDPDDSDKRILIARDLGEIYNDSILNTAPYADFINWHLDHDTQLLWTEKSTAERLREKYNLKTTDIGLWKESFAVFFEQEKNKEDFEKPPKTSGDATKVYKEESVTRSKSKSSKEIVTTTMAPKGSDLFEKAMNYINEIKAQKLEIDIPLVQKELVEAWEGYVGCEKRLEKLGKFLLDVLGEYREYRGRILDAAPGIGCEVIFLLHNRFDVSVNEADPGFNRKIRERIGSVMGRNIEIYPYDWRKLSENLTPVYSAVLVLGNSLCMARERDNREKCIKEFYNLLISGGKLIIDERNFPLIMRERENYQRRKIMYAGDVLDFKLAFENGNLIRFRFFRVDRLEKEIGSMVVEALEENEMKDLLHAAGFENIVVYSDLEEGYKEDVDFYTYVATKPNM